jgi:hypothetical protein
MHRVHDMETPAHRRRRGLLLGGGGGAVEGALLRGLGGLGARALVLRAAPQVGGRAVDEPLQGTGLRSAGLSCHRTRAHAHASVRPCMHHRHKRRGISANASVLSMRACMHHRRRHRQRAPPGRRGLLLLLRLARGGLPRLHPGLLLLPPRAERRVRSCLPRRPGAPGLLRPRKPPGRPLRHAVTHVLRLGESAAASY